MSDTSDFRIESTREMSYLRSYASEEQIREDVKKLFDAASSLDTLKEFLSQFKHIKEIINRRGEYGTTVLFHVAATRPNDEDIIMLLLKYGARVEAIYELGTYPILIPRSDPTLRFVNRVISFHQRNSHHSETLTD